MCKCSNAYDEITDFEICGFFKNTNMENET